MAKATKFKRSGATGVRAQLLETLKTIIYAALVAAVIRTLLFEPFNIPSGSMIPTLQVGDFLFVAKYSYGYSHFSLPFSPPLFSGRIFFHMPHRGDVAVFRYPRDTTEDYIKRIVGLPGDHIQMREGVLYVNGVEAVRTPIGPYIADDNGRKMETERFSEALPDGPTHDILKATDEGWVNNTQEYVVPDGTFFAMGDNRDDSADSRFSDGVGYVPMENLIGKAEFIFFSWDGENFGVRWNRFFKAIH
jgi:signal peptidase I